MLILIILDIGLERARRRGRRGERIRMVCLFNHENTKEEKARTKEEPNRESQKARNRFLGFWLSRLESLSVEAQQVVGGTGQD